MCLSIMTFNKVPPSFNSDSTSSDNKVVRRKLIPIRLLTPTRPAIELEVIQRLDDDGRLTIPTITVRGVLPTYIESWQFALDYGIAMVVASFYAQEWTTYMEGKR